MIEGWTLIESLTSMWKGDQRTDDQKLPPPNIIANHILWAYNALLYQQTITNFEKFGRNNPNAVIFRYDPLLYTDDEYEIVLRPDGRKIAETPEYDFTMPYSTGAQRVYFVDTDGIETDIPMGLPTDLQFASRIPWASPICAMTGRDVHFGGKLMVKMVRIVTVRSISSLDIDGKPVFIMKAELVQPTLDLVYKTMLPEVSKRQDAQNDNLDNAM